MFAPEKGTAMEIIPVRTRKIHPPKDDIRDIFEHSFPKLLERDIVVITSKIIAIAQGRCVPFDEVDEEAQLIHNEADAILSTMIYQGKPLTLTLKDHVLIPSAGIDRSNGNNYFILWPHQPQKEARELCTFLKQQHQLKQLAVIITDSRPLPMRKGTLGISIGFYGLEPYRSYFGQSDVFGQPLQMTRANIVDALAAIAVMGMGEGAEQTPIVILRDPIGVEFTDRETYHKLFMPADEDIYRPLIDCVQNSRHHAID